jgi:hypothetical protein
MSDQQRLLDVYFQEYNQLKHEQAQRIGFRDNLLYVTLGVYGTILGFAVGEQASVYALLVLPWVSLVLGWTYLVNDQKITAIGRYIRYTLVEKIGGIIAQTDTVETESIFGWEIAHRSDERRKRRKIEQLIVDEIAFVFSGLGALLAFMSRYLPQWLAQCPEANADWTIWALGVLCLIEFVLLMMLLTRHRKIVHYNRRG